MPEHLLERRGVPMGRPQLELDVTGRLQAYQIIISSRDELDAGDRLRMAAVECFRKPHHRCQSAHGPARGPSKRAVIIVRLFRHRLSMVSRDKRDDINLLGLEPPQITVADQVLRVPVVALVADVDAHVMKEARILQPLSFGVAKAVNASGLVEHRQAELRDASCVIR